MTFRGWAFVIYGVLATLIYTIMGFREVQQRKRSGPTSPESEKVEGEFNRANWPLLLGFIIALFMSQPENGISEIWWVGVLVLALALSVRSLIKLRTRESLAVADSAPLPLPRQRYKFHLQLPERQALFFGILWIVAVLIYVFAFDDDEKFTGYGTFGMDWHKIYSWTLIPSAFAIVATFAYRRIFKKSKD